MLGAYHFFYKLDTASQQKFEELISFLPEVYRVRKERVIPFCSLQTSPNRFSEVLGNLVEYVNGESQFEMRMSRLIRSTDIYPYAFNNTLLPCLRTFSSWLLPNEIQERHQQELSQLRNLIPHSNASFLFDGHVGPPVLLCDDIPMDLLQQFTEATYYMSPITVKIIGISIWNDMTSPLGFEPMATFLYPIGID